MTLDVAFRHAYPGGFALDIDFRSEALVTALFGASGSGKTTTLAVISGAMQPQTGRVQLNGRTLLDIQAGRSLPMRARGIGMVFQEHRLFPHLTTQQNLLFGHRRGGRRIRLDDVVEALQLEGLLARFPHQLSGGQRRRVALGRALLCEGELLVLDEPLGALDESLKGRVLGYLERIVTRWQVTTLFVTHSQAEVRRLAHWVVVLDEGRVVAQGVPEEALGSKAALGLRAARSGPVNVLRVADVQRAGEHYVGRLGEQLVHLPPDDRALPPEVTVQCVPSDVVLSARDVAGVSARNHLRGIVRRVTQVSHVVFVAVDVGQTLWCEVTPEAVRELGLEPGREVVCLVKTHSLEVVE